MFIGQRASWLRAMTNLKSQIENETLASLARATDYWMVELDRQGGNYWQGRKRAPERQYDMVPARVS